MNPSDCVGPIFRVRAGLQFGPKYKVDLKNSNQWMEKIVYAWNHRIVEVTTQNVVYNNIFDLNHMSGNHKKEIIGYIMHKCKWVWK